MVKEIKTKCGRGSLEYCFIRSASWKKGYAAFHSLFRQPRAWLYLTREGEEILLPLDRAGKGSAHKAAEEQALCEAFIRNFSRSELKEKITAPYIYPDRNGKPFTLFPISYGGRSRGFVICYGIDPKIENISALRVAFQQFLNSELDRQQKESDLKNFQETVHPRALALSTMHSVHRVVSLVMSLEDLLPKIGRLSMQILKVQKCSIWMLDEAENRLVSKFRSVQAKGEAPLYRKLGSGVEGKVAFTGEIHFARKLMALPFMDENLVGVIVVEDKNDGKPFNLTDLEIFKILSEQTVAAIKNIKLHDETQQLTVGSIKSINELLEMDVAGDNVHLPLFAELTKSIGLDMGLGQQNLISLERAVFLLDTGYIGMPNDIFSQERELTREEFELVKQHPLRGANALKSIGSLKPVLPIIMHHHERYDGKGYPHGLKGEEIPMGARIIAVVDAFTAMISARPYRKTRSVRAAVEEIVRHRDSQFDSKIVESFLRVVETAPIVRLITNQQL